MRSNLARFQSIITGISATSGPRAVRASRPPRLIFVGVTDGPWRKVRSARARRPGMRWRRLLGLDSRLRSVSPAHVWPEIDPALGFASCRVGGHIAVHRPGLVPGSDHQPPELSRPTHSSATLSYPLVGLPTILPITQAISNELPSRSDRDDQSAKPSASSSFPSAC